MIHRPGPGVRPFLFFARKRINFARIRRAGSYTSITVNQTKNRRFELTP